MTIAMEEVPGARTSEEESVEQALTTELADLDANERAILVSLLERVKTYRGERRPFTDISLLNDFMRIDPRRDDFSSFEDAGNAIAPPVIKPYPGAEQIPLPTDFLPIEYPLREVITKRASRRDFSKGAINLRELSTLLHYGWGVRGTIMAYNVKHFPNRLAPSMGGLQSVEVYLTANSIEGLDQGLYHYNAANHSLDVLDRGNPRRSVVRSCLFMDWVDAASAVLFLSCDMNKVYWKYGKRAYRFVHVDLGIVAHNLHLVATALRLRSCMIAAYVEEAVERLLKIDGRTEFAGLLLPIGRKPWEPEPPDREESGG